MKFLYFIFTLNAVLFSLAVFDVFSIPDWLFICMAIWLGASGLLIIKGK